MLDRFFHPLVSSILASAALLGCAPLGVPLDDERADEGNEELEECPTSLKTASGDDAWNLLYAAVLNKDEARTLEGLAAVSSSPAPRSCFREWSKLLWYAASTGFGSKVIEPMLEAGLDPNVTDIDIDPLCSTCTGVRRGMTALHYATQEISYQVYPLHGIASGQERLVMVKVLLERGADPNRVCAGALYSGGNEVGSAAIGGATPLMFSAGWSDHGAAMAAAEELLAAGAEVNVRALSHVTSPTSFEEPIASGATALSLARSRGNAALVERLLSAGAIDWDLEAEERAAKSSSKEEIAEILATKIVDHDRIWSLWFDERLGRAPIETLLDAGLDPNARTWGAKYTPLWATVFQAAVYARLPAEDLRALVEAGVDLEDGGALGMPPLIAAIDRYKADARAPEVVAMLLEAGAPVDGRAADGDTSLLRMFYTQRGPEVEDLLLNAGADPNAVNHAGQRPLSVAVRAPVPLPMVERLLSAGADLNADIAGTPVWAHALAHNPLYVPDHPQAELHKEWLLPVLDRIVNHPSLVIDLSSPAVEKALLKADSNPLVKPFADVIRKRAASSACAHSICAPGAALDPDCDPCARSICDADPFCCDSAWDGVCVAEVGWVCGAGCD
ncbi:MAG: hypothetical protein JNL21_29255 [Myxococcales bacterium]|nr:hypothetical protein [Myxococcales bacterium]